MLIQFLDVEIGRLFGLHGRPSARRCAGKLLVDVKLVDVLQLRASRDCKCAACARSISIVKDWRLAAGAIELPADNFRLTAVGCRLAAENRQSTDSRSELR